MVGVPTLDELLNSDPDQFVSVHTDIGAVNLACARGLPNCDENAFPDYLALLDTIAEAVRRQTEKSLRLFKLKPKQFNNSEAVFRLYTMEHVFRVQFGIRYDSKVREQTANGRRWMSNDSSETFINGLLSSKRTGTCSSMPTFAIAVGRRLGYPLKLILVPRHTLYRWDDGNESVNMQPHEAGGEVKDDAYFHTWPEVWDADDFAMNEHFKVWLYSLTPKQEVSKFLCNRALMLRNFGQYAEAFDAVDAAKRYNPIHPSYSAIRESIHYAKAGGNLPKLLAGEVSKLEQLGTILKVMPDQRPPDQLAETLSAYCDFCGGADVTVESPISSFAEPLPPPPSPATVVARRRAEQAAFSDEQSRLVRLINESNRNRSSQHPNGKSSTEPLLQELTRLIQSRMEQ